MAKGPKPMSIGLPVAVLVAVFMLLAVEIQLYNLLGDAATEANLPKSLLEDLRRLHIQNAGKEHEDVAQQTTLQHVQPQSQVASVAASAEERLRAVRAAQKAREHIDRSITRVGGAEPVPPLSEPGDNNTIVVMLSAFQDGERCARTMYRALKKAKVPSRVKFSVLQAREPYDPDCALIFEKTYLPQLCQESSCKNEISTRTHAWTIAAAAGKGPAHQRGVASKLLRYESDDDFCLSMDSHMDFKEGWDDAMIKDWALTRNEFAVLSAYPADVAQIDHYGYFVDLCGYSMEGSIPRGMGGGDKRARPEFAPYLTMNWAAGLSFGRCHLERAVPVDMHLPWIFTGEEIDRAVRLFTHGYDLYLPSGMHVLHEYAHAGQTFWKYRGSDRDAGAEKSKKRLRKLLDRPQAKPIKAGDNREDDFAQAVGEYGLGTQRTLEDYVKWSRVDLGGWGEFLKSTIGFLGAEPDFSRHEWCQTLKRPPVTDEVGLVASIGTLSASGASARQLSKQGHVVIPGAFADVKPIQELPHEQPVDTATAVV